MSRPRGIQALFEARSVAVVGASPRPGTPGYQMVRQLRGGGFDGDVFLVNPGHQEIDGLPCFASLRDLPDPVDLAMLGVPNRALEEQMRLVAELGVPGAVIFASGYEEDPGEPPLTERVTAIADEGGVTVCGGNCMGFVNFDRGLRALAFEESFELQPGPIAWISHSGSAFTALLHNDRSLGFNIAVSAGQEFTTTVADYISFAAELPTTRVIAVFLEAVRDPDSFVDALRSADAADVPIVVLKVGKERSARRLITAHSGALAGEDAVHDAVFEAHGVRRVRSLNEMMDVLELFASGRRARSGGLASIHDSGGERAHFVDMAAETGVAFADPAPETIARLESILEPGLPAVNPVDAWGTGRDFEKIFLGCARALIDDPDTGAFAFVVDLAGEDLELGYTQVAEQLFDETDIPFAVLSNVSAAIDREAAARLRGSGIPVLEDTAYGLRAFGHLFALRDHSALDPVELTPPPASAGRWLEKLRSGEAWSEAEGLQLLADHGISTAAAHEVSSLDAALDRAEEIGYPVALKITGVEHKSDAGGVTLGLADEDELLRAYRRMAGRFGPHLLVQAMAPAGVEMALGMVRDPQFGPVVLVAAGGIEIETLQDRRLGVPPLDGQRARRMIDSLRARPLLDGTRGRAATHVDSLAEAITRLSALALHLGPEMDALDVNPVMVGPEGCVAVDALVVPKRATP